VTFLLYFFLVLLLHHLSISFLCFATGSALLYFRVRIFFNRPCNCVYRFPSILLLGYLPTISLQTAWYLENWPQFYFWVLFVVLQTLWFGPVVGTHLRVKNCQCGNYDILELYLKHDFLLMSRSRVKEYLPITGLAGFNKLSAKLIFGADRYFLWDISTHVLPLVIFMSHLLLLVIFMVNCEFLELKSNNIKFLPTWLLVFHICLVTLESWLCFFLHQME
jgi:hypothetical protein